MRARPGRGTSPCTLERGHAQLELGLFDDSFQHRSGVTTDTDTVGSLLAKWGASERMDVEAGIAFYQHQRLHDASGTTTMTGVGDLFLHAKYNPLGDGAFALVLDPFLKLPTASGGMSNGGTLALLVNDRKVGEGHVEKTAGFKYSLYEGQDIGEDSGSPVDYDYTPPFKFTGNLQRVTVELK